MTTYEGKIICVTHLNFVVALRGQRGIFITFMNECIHFCV